MNKGLLIFLLLIPVIVALGHDVYYYYEHQEEGFKLSELGWVWTTYHTDSHDALFEKTGQDTWKQYFVPILSLYSVLAALIFSGVVLLIVIMVKALSAMGGKRFSPKKKSGSLGRERGVKNQIKYNRK